jgi:hypothetical protein
MLVNCSAFRAKSKTGNLLQGIFLGKIETNYLIILLLIVLHQTIRLLGFFITVQMTRSCCVLLNTLTKISTFIPCRAKILKTQTRHNKIEIKSYGAQLGNLEWARILSTFRDGWKGLWNWGASLYGNLEETLPCWGPWRIIRNGSGDRHLFP